MRFDELRPWLVFSRDAFGKMHVACYWCGLACATEEQIANCKRNGIEPMWVHEPRTRNSAARWIRDHLNCAPLIAARS